MDDEVISISINFAFIGGFGFEVGIVTDKNGGKKFFYSYGVNIGYGIGATLNINQIYSTPGNSFKVSDFEGPSSGFSAGVGEIGGNFGGNKNQWEFDSRTNSGFFDFGYKYKEVGIGASTFSGSKGPIFGIWWYNSKTKFFK